MDVFYVALAAFGGGILDAVLGWLKAGESFSARKFWPSIIRALLAGGVFAVTFSVVDKVPAAEDFVAAVLAGAGVDAGLHRLTGIKAS